MSAHVLLNLFNKLRKSGKCDFFATSLARARMLDSRPFYFYMTLLLKIRIFGVKHQTFVIFWATLKWT